MRDFDAVLPRAEAGQAGSRLDWLAVGFPAWWWVAVAAALSAVLGAYEIGRAGLWTDELFSRYYYDLLGPSFMFGPGLRLEPSPPTYFVLLKGWMAAFGTGAAAMRSLSAVAYTACVPAVFLLAREVAGRRAAILATLLFAISPMGLYFAQEARVYALTLLPSCLLLWATAVLMRSPRAPGAMAVYVLSGTVCLYLHASLLFLVACCGGCGLAWMLLRPAEGRGDALRWCGLNAAVIVSGSPYLYFMLIVGRSHALDWMPGLSLRGVASVATAFLTGMLTPRPEPGLILAACVCGSLAAALMRRAQPARYLVIALIIPCLFFVLVCSASLIRPMLIPRILCWMVVPLAVLTARQIVAGGWQAWAVSGSVLMASFVGLSAQHADPFGGKEPWAQVFADIAPRAKESDLVVMSPTNNALIPHAYAPELNTVRIWDANVPQTVMTEADKRLGATLMTTAQIERRILSGKTVWLVANTFDRGYADLLKLAVPPSYDAKWNCGRNVCVEVVGWAGHREIAGRGAVLAHSVQ